MNQPPSYTSARANTRAYGHAGCCGCNRDIDLASGPSALSGQQGNLSLHFFYCSACFSRLRAGGGAACISAIEEVLKESLEAWPNHTGLAMTTSLALQRHQGDLVRAYEIGIDMPRILFDAIALGEAEAAVFPFFGLEA